MCFIQQYVYGIKHIFYCIEYFSENRIVKIIDTLMKKFFSVKFAETNKCQ